MQDELLAVKAGLEQRQLACVKMLLPRGDSMQETTKQARKIQYPACMAHNAVHSYLHASDVVACMHVYKCDYKQSIQEMGSTDLVGTGDGCPSVKVSFLSHDSC